MVNKSIQSAHRVKAHPSRYSTRTRKRASLAIKLGKISGRR